MDGNKANSVQSANNLQSVFLINNIYIFMNKLVFFCIFMVGTINKANTNISVHDPLFRLNITCTLVIWFVES